MRVLISHIEKAHGENKCLMVACLAGALSQGRNQPIDL